jgi:hypothetical protein
MIDVPFDRSTARPGIGNKPLKEEVKGAQARVHGAAFERRLSVGPIP